MSPFLLWCGLVGGIALSAQGQERAPLDRAIDVVVEQLLDAHRAHQLVAIAERHTRLLDSDIRLALVRHPDFPTLVDVVVVEFATRLHQGTLDRYIAGEDVPEAELREVWRNTGAMSLAWESPVYREFLDAIREVNRGVLESQRVRVVASDPPIDWNTVRSRRDLEGSPSRGSYPAEVIVEEVFDRGLRALGIFSFGHLEKWRTGFTPTLARLYGGEVFVVSYARGDEALSRLQQTIGLGAEPALVAAADPRLRGQLARIYLPTGDSLATEALSDVVDALLYSGTAPDVFVPPGEIDSAYRAEVERRRRAVSLER